MGQENQSQEAKARKKVGHPRWPINTQHLLISTLLSPEVKAFMAEIESEVEKLCGSRYQHGKTIHR
ncbi:MAG: hypothetical protein B7Y39_14040 [Bdellovibrio sp. 28-41-41]|nr:MAG: hypothetical protein B7Y39_14040 [Bdellovibrio sp. 28-41-41]